MKKTLALILSLLVAFSMFTVATFAEGTADDLVTVKFVDGDKLIKEVEVKVGTILTPYMPANPEKADTATERYTFKGWRSSFDGELYFSNISVTVPAVEGEVTFTAEYSVEEIGERQSFWNFIESIFERINLIFQYFAEIFRFD